MLTLASIGKVLGKILHLDIIFHSQQNLECDHLSSMFIKYLNSKMFSFLCGMKRKIEWSSCLLFFFLSSGVTE